MGSLPVGEESVMGEAVGSEMVLATEWVTILVRIILDMAWESGILEDDIDNELDWEVGVIWGYWLKQLRSTISCLS